MAGKRPTGLNDSEVRMRAKERWSNEGEVSRKEGRVIRREQCGQEEGLSEQEGQRGMDHGWQDELEKSGVSKKKGGICKKEGGVSRKKGRVSRKEGR
jgi:hypothetical protein